nr:GtrA family protein [Ramlibacter algicola]
MAGRALSIAVLYTLFAAISTAINLGAQMASMWIYGGPRAVEVSILVGTAAGLPLRYVLEKRFIFDFSSRSLVHDGQLFTLYSFMGVFTTLIFWSVEYAFHLAFGSASMRYAGAVVGLGIGFYVKYQLDKRYVFVSAPAARFP